MLADWNSLPDPLQLVLSREAFRHAADAIALQAEVIAEEMEGGGIADRGGPEALRLLVGIVRATACIGPGPGLDA